jgi:predicted transporter
MATPRNVLLLKVFAPILIGVGFLGFLTPPELALTSGAAPYNVFHLVFGVIGLGCAFSGNLQASRAFNFGFGLIDLYQAVASFAALWPQQHFQWKRADDVLHVVIGLLLVGVAVALDRPRAAAA